MLLGCHVSIREGYLGAAKHARQIGATAFQYFPKNPRSLSVKRLDQSDAEACRQYCQQYGLVSIAHTPYPTNLAIDDPDLYRLTVESLRNDLAIANACGSLGIVVHFGQYKQWETEPLRGYQRMIKMLNEVLGDWQGETLLLIENNAGQGNRMGSTLEELAQVRSLLACPEKVGFCLDTCHAFASGLWNGSDWQAFVQAARKLDYLGHVKAVHLNDSMFPHRSYRDRHANIGKGYIPPSGFAELFATPEFRDIPFVLETPTAQDTSHQSELMWIQQQFFAEPEAAMD